MADFKIIETQEQLDAVIKDRLERAEKKHSEASAELQKKLEALEAEKKEQEQKIEGFTKDLETIRKENDENKAKIKKYESDSVKTRIAKEAGIPEGMAERLRGETEEELKKDAEALAKLLPRREPPKKDPDPALSEKNRLETDLKNFLKSKE